MTKQSVQCKRADVVDVRSGVLRWHVDVVNVWTLVRAVRRRLWRAAVWFHGPGHSTAVRHLQQNNDEPSTAPASHLSTCTVPCWLPRWARLPAFVVELNKKLCMHAELLHSVLNQYVGPPYCRTEVYAGRVACCPLVSARWVCRQEWQTDGRKPDRYFTLCTKRGQHI